jgi:Bacterial SH3 domain
LPPPDEQPPPPARPAVARRPVAPPPVYEEYDDYDEVEYSMLRNPYVLAALAVAGAIILAVAFVIIFSEGGDSPGSSAGIVSNTPTPAPGELPGVQAKVIAIAAIREGPGLEFFELGLLRNGQDVSVVGRNDDSSWYQIIFAGTELKGWVPHSALRVPDGADALIETVVFTPIPKPSVEQPTPTPAATPTEEALGPPDISVEVLGNVCPASGPINLAIRNVGDVDLTARRIILTVSTPEGVINEQPLSLTLGIGQIVPINTGIEVQAPRTIVAIVFASEPQDLDPSNNVVTCVVAGDGGPGPNSTSVPPTPEN